MDKPLDLRKPAVVDQVFGGDDAPEPHAMARDRRLIEQAVKYAKDNGYDGLIHPDSDNFNRYSNGQVSYAVFKKDPLQLAPLTGMEQGSNTDGVPMRGAQAGDNATLSTLRDQTSIPSLKVGMGTGRMQTMNKIDQLPSFQAFLLTLPEATGDEWTQDEARMSTPFSDLEAWQRIVLSQLLSGKSFLRGPPGLWEKMEILLSSTTAQERTSLYFNQDMQDEWIRAGLGAAPTPPAAKT